ncbi:MAG: FAD:protein FMN transferase [candidate division FCPU426 bacterium]
MTRRAAGPTGRFPALRGWLVLALAAGMAAAGIWWGVSRQAGRVQQRTRFLLNTVCSLRVQGGPEWLPVLDRTLDEVARLNVVFNPRNPDSPLFAFNDRNQPITDPEIIAVVEAAQQVGRESQGAFDITVYPLSKLWKTAREANRVPAEAEVARLRALVDYRQIVVAGGRITKARPEVQIDLGGIAKGYAVKLAADRLRAAGCRAGLVDFGGNLYVIGRMGRTALKVGIQEPRGTGLTGVLEVQNQAVSTSGDYERYFEAAGVRYHHLLDPRTGWPAGRMQSVTVVAVDPMLADAWSTAFFIQGPDWTRAYCRTHPALQAAWVTGSGEFGMTDQLRPRFTFVKPLSPQQPPQSGQGQESQGQGEP